MTDKSKEEACPFLFPQSNLNKVDENFKKGFHHLEKDSLSTHMHFLYKSPWQSKSTPRWYILDSLGREVGPLVLLGGGGILIEEVFSSYFVSSSILRYNLELLCRQALQGLYAHSDTQQQT